MPQNFKAGEPRKHCPAFVAKTSEKAARRSALGLVLKTSNADRSPPPFQFGDGGIIDDIAPPQRTMVSSLSAKAPG